jgi:hypothetical protein
MIDPLSLSKLLVIRQHFSYQFMNYSEKVSIKKNFYE